MEPLAMLVPLTLTVPQIAWRPGSDDPPHPARHNPHKPLNKKSRRYSIAGPTIFDGVYKLVALLDDFDAMAFLTQVQVTRPALR